jgi:hypothetical protein
MEVFRLTVAQYNKLLPALRAPLYTGNAMLHRRAFRDSDEHYLIGTRDDYVDAMARCAFID